MTQSGGIFEATRFSRPCEVSRTTINNYLKVLEATFVVHVLRPFSSHRPAEIVAAPKVYTFDTGFICYHRGWRDLRQEDLGILWEHFVLNEIHSCLQSRNIHYWRDKRGHEVDFIWITRGEVPVTIECKWSAVDFDPSGIKAFRRQYSQGKNLVVAQDVDRPFHRSDDEISVEFVSLSGLIERILS